MAESIEESIGESQRTEGLAGFYTNTYGANSSELLDYLGGPMLTPLQRYLGVGYTPSTSTSTSTSLSPIDYGLDIQVVNPNTALSVTPDIGRIVGLSIMDTDSSAGMPAPKTDDPPVPKTTGMTGLEMGALGLSVAGTVGNLIGLNEGLRLDKKVLKDQQAQTQILREKRNETAKFKQGLSGAFN